MRAPLCVALAVAATACSSLPTATPPTTTTKTPPIVAHQGRGATDRLEREHHLVQALPHATARYRIDFTLGPDGRLALQVTLLPVLNRAGDLAGYGEELRRDAAEALAHVEAQGDDPATFTVTYQPPEEGP